MENRVIIEIDDIEEIYLKSLIEYHQKTASDLFKWLLLAEYNKVVDNIKSPEKLSQEQLCEQIEGGRVVRAPDGEYKCEYPEGAFKTVMPLSMVGTEDCDIAEINELNRKIINRNPKV